MRRRTDGCYAPVPRTTGSRGRRHNLHDTTSAYDCAHHTVLPLRLRRLFCNRTTSVSQQSLKPRRRHVLLVRVHVFSIFNLAKLNLVKFSRKNVRRFAEGGTEPDAFTTRGSCIFRTRHREQHGLPTYHMCSTCFSLSMALS